MKKILDIIHDLERMQFTMRTSQFFEAARSLEVTIEHLRHEYSVAVLKYENTYETLVLR